MKSLGESIYYSVLNNLVIVKTLIYSKSVLSITLLRLSVMIINVYIGPYIRGAIILPISNTTVEDKTPS